MKTTVYQQIDTLAQRHSLPDYLSLLSQMTPEAAQYLADKARQVRESIYGKTVYIRGLIEVSNICRNDCYYCGIRKSNALCDRYRLTPDQILSCCAEGYTLGFRTFVLQGGEDGAFTDRRLTDLLYTIKERYPDNGQ